MKTITVNIEKGGTGKTTNVFNLGGYSADEKGLRVLFIDQDKSKNLSDRFENYLKDKEIKPENTITNLYRGGILEPINIRENIDILVADFDLEDIEDEIKYKPNNRLMLFSWYVKNYEKLNDLYDLIIIDTHNDTGLLAQNAWAVSDIVLGVSDPSKDGFKAVQKLGREIKELSDELVDIRTGEKYIVAKYYFVAGRVKYNTKSSREFLEILQNEENYIGLVHERELLNGTSLESEPITQLAKKGSKVYRDNKEFIEELYSTFDAILDKANE